MTLHCCGNQFWMANMQTAHLERIQLERYCIHILILLLLHKFLQMISLFLQICFYTEQFADFLWSFLFFVLGFLSQVWLDAEFQIAITSEVIHVNTNKSLELKILSQRKNIHNFNAISVSCFKKWIFF